MSGRIDARLGELGITLPAAPAPAANYVPFQWAGGLLAISGQLPMRDGAVVYAGKVGQDVSLEDGVAAARLCMINILAQAKAACEGDLDRIVRCVRLGGFVNCIGTYADHPKIINGASDLAVKVLGDAGRHARAAVGVASLPMNAAVEVDALFQVG